MGSSVSRLEIVLEQDKGQHELLPLAAGSLLRGRVVTELKGPLQMTYPIAAAKPGESPLPALQLRLYGKEKVRMNRHKAVQTSGTYNGRARKSAERQFLNLLLQWPTFPVGENTNVDTSTVNGMNSLTTTTIPAGTCVFPFQIQLPASLPSSTYYPVNDNRARSKLNFRIQYKLVAALNLSSSSSSKPMTVTRYLWIVAAAPNPSPEPVPCMVEPISQQLRGGFFKKGTFLFGASLENCCVQDALNLHVACRNDSAVAIRRVQISVLEKLTWGTGAVNHINPVTGVCRTGPTLQQTATVPVVVLKDVQLPGLAKEGKGVFRSVVDTVFGSAQQKFHRQIYEDLITDENLTRIQLPVAARESYQGQLIQVSHILKIEFLTEALARTPVLEIPIHILGTAEPENAQRPHQPAVASGACEAYHVPPPAPAEPPRPAKTAAPLKKPTKPLLAATTGVAASAIVGTSTDSATPETSVTHAGRKYHSQNEIPIVNAVQIPDDAAQASVAMANVVVLGGDAVLRSQLRMTSLNNLVPMAAPTRVVSVNALLGEMRSSINEFELIMDKLLDPVWVTLFQKMTPDEFGSVVAGVHEFDQPRVAVLLAPHLNRGSGLTCAYAAAALRSTSANHRAIMAQKLLPLCVDVKEHHGLILAELNGWEQTVTESVFQDAMR